MEARIEGLYDIRTVNFLLENQIQHLGFDFNPRSLNFLQYHLFLEIYAQYLGKKQKTYLNFENDSPLMINYHSQSLTELIENKGYKSEDLSIYLELSEGKKEYLDQFDMSPFRGFLVHYRPGISEFSLSEVAGHKKFFGVFLHYEDLQSMHDEQTLHSFVQNFHGQLFESGRNELQLGLVANWEDDLYPSILDLFDFDIISFKISREVEVCFRNVDLNKVGKTLGQLNNLSL